MKRHLRLRSDERAWPAVARDEQAPRALREWAQKLEAKANAKWDEREKAPWLI